MLIRIFVIPTLVVVMLPNNVTGSSLFPTYSHSFPVYSRPFWIPDTIPIVFVSGFTVFVSVRHKKYGNENERIVFPTVSDRFHPYMQIQWDALASYLARGLLVSNLVSPCPCPIMGSQ